MRSFRLFDGKGLRTPFVVVLLVFALYLFLSTHKDQQELHLPRRFLKKACVDTDVQCESWAQSGECEKNPSFMSGVPGVPGKCNLACGTCVVKRAPTPAN